MTTREKEKFKPLLGIGANPQINSINKSIINGEKIKSNEFPASTKKKVLPKSFTASAKGWVSPQKVTLFGPSRIWL